MPIIIDKEKCYHTRTSTRNKERKRTPGGTPRAQGQRKTPVPLLYDEFL